MKKFKQFSKQNGPTVGPRFPTICGAVDIHSQVLLICEYNYWWLHNLNHAKQENYKTVVIQQSGIYSGGCLTTFQLYTPWMMLKALFSQNLKTTGLLCRSHALNSWAVLYVYSALPTLLNIIATYLSSS